MINGITDDCGNNDDKEDDKFKVKNEYTWKEKGGSKLLEQLYDENTDKDEDSDTDNDFGATDLGGFAKLRKKSLDDKGEESLFGPIGLKKCEEMQAESDHEQSPAKLESQVHIDVINMDNGIPEFDKK